MKTKLSWTTTQTQNVTGTASELSPKRGRFHGFVGRPPLDYFYCIDLKPEDYSEA
jgi:hypothetical protein